uniref:Uncharacterized protein n=1 Tax=Anguilla anguilla TaxID=7936 RepID=A0A0E9VQU4_ANGAN
MPLVDMRSCKHFIHNSLTWKFDLCNYFCFRHMSIEHNHMLL